MPRKKIVSTESAVSPVETGTAPSIEEKSRKVAAKSASSPTRTNRRKLTGRTPVRSANENGTDEKTASEILGSMVSDEEQVALLAYSFWEARGRQGGSPEEDWYRAVHEIRARSEKTAKSRPN